MNQEAMMVDARQPVRGPDFYLSLPSLSAPIFANRMETDGQTDGFMASYSNIQKKT
jgi:hypothetical protein